MKTLESERFTRNTCFKKSQLLRLSCMSGSTLAKQNIKVGGSRNLKVSQATQDDNHLQDKGVGGLGGVDSRCFFYLNHLPNLAL